VRSPWAARRARRGSRAACTAWKRKSGTPGEQHAVAELGDQFALAARLEQVGRDRARVHEAGCEYRAQQQPSEVRGDLRPRGGRTLLGAQLAPTEHVEEAGEWGERHGHAVGTGTLGAEQRKGDAEHHADGAIGAHHDRIRLEPSAATRHTAGEVHWRVTGERHHQGEQQHPVAVEVGIGDDLAEHQHHHEHRSSEDAAEQGDLAQHRTSTLVECSAGRYRPAEFLLEWQEEPRREGERGEPQRQHRGEGVVAPEGVFPDLQEHERRETRDEQAQPHRDGALR